MRKAKFDTLAKSVPNKVSELLDCEPIESLVINVGQQTVQAYIEAEIVKLASMFNGNSALNLKDHQVPVIAEHLMENYKWESIEDFTLCFRKALSGYYGEVYRIDGAVIGQWFSRYLDEKYDALEQRKAKEKKQEAKDVPNYVIDREGKEHPIVDGTDYLKKLLESLGAHEPEKQTNAKENAIQRKKVENPYKYFTVRNIQIMATSQEHAESLVQLMIDRGDLIEDK